MKLAGLSPAGALTVRDGEPFGVSVIFEGADGEPQDLTGRLFSLSVRFADQTTPFLTVAGDLAGDAMSVNLMSTGEQASEIYARGQSRALAYDITESNGVIRWYERVEVVEGSGIAPDAPVVFPDLPVSELRAQARAIVATERGAQGFGAERRLYDAGLIDEPTVAKMDARYAEAGAPFVAEAAQFAATAGEYADAAMLSEANVAAMASQPTMVARSWASVGAVRGLSSLSGGFDGQRAEVQGPDTGTHTDGITGLTVPNTGTYQWVAADAKWTWVAESSADILIASRGSGQYVLGIAPWDSSLILDGEGNRIGLSFANGQNGDTNVADQDAILKVTDYCGLSKIHAGSRIRCVMEFDISAVFRPLVTPFLQVQRAGQMVNLMLAGSPTTTNYSIVQNARVGNVWHVTVDFIATGTEQQASPYLRFSGSNSQGGETISYRDHRFVVAAMADTSLSLFSQQLGALVKGAKLGGSDDGFARALSPVPIVTDASVAPAGADYDDYREAYLEVGAGSITARKRVTLDPGVYIHDAAETGDVSYILPEYTDFRGGGAPSRCIVRFFQPNDVDPALTATNEPMRVWYKSNHYDYRIEGKNVRYTIHADPAGAYPDNAGDYFDQDQYYEGMEVVHYGNKGAVDYQTSLGGSGNPGGVWSLARPIGYGGSSGWNITFRACLLQSDKYVFGYHDNKDFAEKSYVTVGDCALIATTADDAAYAYRFSVLGSGKPSKVFLEGNRSNGDLQLVFGPWLSVDPANQPADPGWQFQIYGKNHDPMKVEISGAMRALKIASATTGSGSSIDLSGTTQALLDAWFGDVYARGGSGSLAGYVWGYNNVNASTVGSPAVQINSLGVRAGNRVGAPWVLSVAIDGGAPIVITFSTNLSAVANSTLLATINAALGGAAVASEYNIVARHRPAFAGEESPRRNNSAVAIPINAWVAGDTSFRKIRLMTSADALWRSGGSAFADDIYPGEAGRVKHGGVWGPADLIINGAPSLVYGDLLEIDASAPGALVKNNGSARAVLMCAGSGLFVRAK